MTNWELGNEIMCGVVDRLRELAQEAKSKRTDVAKVLENIALDFGPLVNRLMNDDHDDPVGMCPMRTNEDGECESYVYFDGTSKRVFDPYKRF